MCWWPAAQSAAAMAAPELSEPLPDSSSAIRLSLRFMGEFLQETANLLGDSMLS
jgi:hypothetical protein